MEKRYSLLIMGCISIAIISIIASFYMPYNGEETSATIESAKQLKISASEIGTGWEGEFGYISDPVKTFEEACEYLETMKGELKKNITDEEVFQENLEKDKARFLELRDKLREYDVKDGYFLFLQKLDKPPKSLVEADVFVFNNTNGARKFFDYMKNKLNGSSISGIGDEAAISKTETTHIWLVRTSNACIKVIVWDGKETGRLIAERIMDKAEKWKKDTVC